jgi:hypothetical protein
VSATLAGVSVNAQPQGVTVPDAVSDAVVCARCTIKLTRVAELRNTFGSDERGAQAAVVAAVRDSRGFTFVSYSDDPSRLLVHDRDGKVLRTLGRSGSGPIEFKRISALIITAGDTLHVFDQIQRRRTVISPSGAFVRSNPLPLNSISVLVLENDAQLLNASIPSSTAIGHPIHVVSTGGSIVKSLGANTPSKRPDGSENDRRLLAVDSDTYVWALHQNQYRLELWSLSGQLARVLTRNTAWFPPWRGQMGSNYERKAPDPYPVGFSKRTSGQYWVVTRVADPDWKSDLVAKRTESGRTLYAVNQPQRAYDSVIELIDVNAGRVIARQRSPDALARFIDREHLMKYSVDDAGRWFAEILRIELVQ